MSRLDNSVKPIVISLMRGTRPLHSLNDEERRLLACWAGKTAIVESYAIEAENPVDTRYLNALRRDEGGPPWKFGVLAHQVKFHAIGHMQISLVSKLLDGTSLAANVVILGVPNLLLACGFPYVDLPCQYRCDTSTYIPVWPGPREWGVMDRSTPALPPATPDSEFLAALAEKIEMHVLFN